MSEKPDYYEVLGVAKTATVEEIKKAHQKIAMRCHPDRLRLRTDMTDQEKEEAAQKLKWATEAEKVLCDPQKRNIYDSFGHKGIENLKTNGGTSARSDGSDLRKPTNYTPEDTFSFFDRMAEKRQEAPADDGRPRLTPEERRQRAAEERQARREAERRARQERMSGNQDSKPSSPADIFNDAAEKAAEELVETLKQAMADEGINIESLQKMAFHLQGFLDEANKVIRTVKDKNKNKPDPKP